MYAFCAGNALFFSPFARQVYVLRMADAISSVPTGGDTRECRCELGFELQTDGKTCRTGILLISIPTVYNELIIPFTVYKSQLLF